MIKNKNIYMFERLKNYSCGCEAHIIDSLGSADDISNPPGNNFSVNVMRCLHNHDNDDSLGSEKVFSIYLIWSSVDVVPI